MTKLKQPILSLGAKGTLADTLTWRRARGRNVVSLKPIPQQPNTLAQLYHRWHYQDYVLWWDTLTSAQKSQWQSDAVPYQMSGFAYWMRKRLSTKSDICALWRLDESAGARAYDTSKNTNTMTLFGPTHVDGKFSHALSFDGLDDYGSRASTPSLNPTSAVTLKLYFYISALPGAWRNLLIHAGYAWGIRITNANKLQFFVKNSAGAYRVDVNFQLTAAHLQTFNRVVATYDGSDGLLFFNGDLKDTDSPGAFTIFTDAVSPIYLATPWPGERYSGIMDDVVILNRGVNSAYALNDFERGEAL